jgi:hypothetical protein
MVFSDHRHQTLFARRVNFPPGLETCGQPLDAFLDPVPGLTGEAETQFVRPGFVRIENFAVGEDDARRSSCRPFNP